MVVGIVAPEVRCCMRRDAGLAYYDQCTSHEFLTFLSNHLHLAYIIFYHIGMDIPGYKLITLSGTITCDMVIVHVDSSHYVTKVLVMPAGV